MIELNTKRINFLLLVVLSAYGCGGSKEAKDDKVDQSAKELAVLNKVDDLEFWLSAGSISQENGSRVSAWTDGSDNGHKGTQNTSGKQPVFYKNRIKSQPAVHFDGTEGLSFDASFLLNSDYTIIVVGARETGDHVNMFVGTATEASHSNFAFGWRQDIGGFLPQTFNLAHYGDDVFGTGDIFSTKTFEIWTGVFSQTSGKQIYKNATLFASAPSVIHALINVDGAMIGYWPLLSTGFEGDIAEIVIYTHALTDNERSRIEKHLQSKYGL